MGEVEIEGAAALAQPVNRPLWKRIVDFPLVTMVLAFTVFLGFTALVSGIAEVALRQTDIPRQQLITAIIAMVAMVFIYKRVIVRMGERPYDDLSGPGALRETIAGIAIGFALFSIIVAAAAVIGVYSVTGTGDASLLLIALIGDGLFPAISEELIFRGILFRWLEQLGGSWAALLISSAIFGFSHWWNPDATLVSSIGISLEAGLLLGGAYMLTRKLWVPMGFHAAWNVTQGEIYGIPVSGHPVHGLIRSRLDGPEILTGGGFGLEASLIAIVIATAFGIYLVVRAVRAGEVVRPWWVRRRLELVAAG